MIVKSCAQPISGYNFVTGRQAGQDKKDLEDTNPAARDVGQTLFLNTSRNLMKSVTNWDIRYDVR